MTESQSPSFAVLCYAKFEGIVVRVFHIIRFLPVRVERIFRHFIKPFVEIKRSPSRVLSFNEHFFWIIELIFYIMDIIGVGEIYETVCDVVKFNSRPLTSTERATVSRIFGRSVNLARIRIDEFAFLGPRTHGFAYVSGSTINCWGELPSELFVHEMAHVWQYHKLGSVYIPRALRAQFSEEGYNYGGLPNLLLAIRTGRGLQHFNLEQQGDILADYSRIQQGKSARWGNITSDDLWVFEHLVEDIRNTAA